MHSPWQKQLTSYHYPNDTDSLIWHALRDYTNYNMTCQRPIPFCNDIYGEKCHIPMPRAHDTSYHQSYQSTTETVPTQY